MQVKKADIMQTIYDCAVQEFLSKGYENSSMRTIAKKANTSIGNIYHYYANKDALLDQMMEKAIIDIENLFQHHLKLSVRIHNVHEIDEAIAQSYRENDISLMIRPELVIFMKQDQERYREKKESILLLFREHLAWHLGCDDPNEYFVKLTLNVFIESIVFIVKANLGKEKTYQEFLRLFRMFCGGLVTKK